MSRSHINKQYTKKSYWLTYQYFLEHLLGKRALNLPCGTSTNCILSSLELSPYLLLAVTSTLYFWPISTFTTSLRLETSVIFLVSFHCLSFRVPWYTVYTVISAPLLVGLSQFKVISSAFTLYVKATADGTPYAQRNVTELLIFLLLFLTRSSLRK